MSELNQGVSRCISLQLWGGQQLVRGVDLVPEVPGAPSAPQQRGAKPLAYFSLSRLPFLSGLV